MDKRAIIGFFLIFLVVILMYTPFYQRLIMGDRKPQMTEAVEDSVSADSTISEPQMAESKIRKDTLVLEEKKAEKATEKLVESAIESPEIATVQIENKFISATISSENGGSLTDWELKNYKSHSGGNLNLIGDNGLDVSFTNSDGKEFNLNEYNLYMKEISGQKVFLDENKPIQEIEFYLPLRNGKITKKVFFYYDKYSIDVIVKFDGLQNYVINRRYFLSWEKGLESTEKNTNEDYSYARAYASMAGELEDLDISANKVNDKSFNGRVDWTSIRTKYFLVSLIPNTPGKMNGAILNASGEKANEHLKKVFSVSLDIPFNLTHSQSDSFTVYLGPLDYNILKSYQRDLQTLIMNKDWYERIFRPIGLLVLYVLKFFHQIIPNYGFVIIIFSVLIKLILHPLTKKSYQSMSEMQYFQPKIAELREKYKSDPQRMQKEMMKFYKEHGINPLGGCLPTLLQMPLLVALFVVFRSTIQLRGQPFALWITDLSQPDELFLGFSLPLLGNTIHVLPILMGITMIWQSKMNITDPKQKTLSYIMPFFLTFIFYSFPSGLNLYYSLFNIFSMVQTRMIKKKMHPGSDFETEADKSKSSKKRPPK
jgi:YidC/Oxa1 family membrane protein insertase